jgi:hypothetical protein
MSHPDFQRCPPQGTSHALAQRGDAVVRRSTRSFDRRAARRAQGSLTRRVVRDHVDTINRKRPELERYIARHVHYPEPVLFTFAEPLASIREIRTVKITRRFRADFSPWT